MNNIEAIKANAKIVIKTFSENNGIILDFDQSSVEWLDGYVERNRKTWDEATVEKLTSVLGSFLGECIRQNYGGNWRMIDNRLGIELSEGNVIFPFSKITKQIENGTEDSILSFYRVIPSVFDLNN